MHSRCQQIHDIVGELSGQPARMPSRRARSFYPTPPEPLESRALLSVWAFRNRHITRFERPALVSPNRADLRDSKMRATAARGRTWIVSRNLPYGTPAGRSERLDVYRPADPSPPG